VDFPAGSSAIVELAKQIQKISGFTNLKQGITVNPGVISGGTRTNVVAAEAEVRIDVRILRASQAQPLEKKLRSLKPFDKRCRLELTGGLNRPPMERSRAGAALFAKARSLAAAMHSRGWKIKETSTGGASDGNFTAALGIPTLDGLGAVGEGAHAPNESVFLAEIPRRTALLAALITSVK
jgi:glutamate carboxypeptidase